MTGPSSLNGASGLHHSPAERHADETLHGFLSRRHDEMGAELINLRALVVNQEFDIAQARWAARRHMRLVIGGEALTAALTATACWFVIPRSLPEMLMTVTATSVLGGVLIAQYAPDIERVFRRVALWRRR